MGEVITFAFQMAHILAIDSPCDIVLVELQLELVDIAEICSPRVTECVLVPAVLMLRCIACRFVAGSAVRVAVLTSVHNESATARIFSHHANIGDGIVCAPLREIPGFESESAILNRLLQFDVTTGFPCTARCAVGCFVGENSCRRIPLDGIF